MNTTANLRKGKQYVKTTMAVAKDLQARYDALGAPATQSIRNPLPVRELIKTVLPVLPNRYYAAFECKFNAVIMLGGKKMVIPHTHSVSASEVVGHEFWKNNGMTCHQVVDALRNKGFLVTTAAVQVALSNGSVPVDKMGTLGDGGIKYETKKFPGKRGRKSHIYFMSLPKS
jgi:hypothetical protein